MLKQVEVFLVNSFTHEGLGGNPAGVVLHSDDLTNDERLKIAQTVGYSETAFVSLGNEANFNVSFFTVTVKLIFVDMQPCRLFHCCIKKAC